MIGVERRRHHASNRVRLIVHRHDAADNRRIGIEPPPPQAVAQYQHAPSGRRVVGGGEVASQRRSDAERAQEVRRHAHRGNPLGLAVRDERRIPRSDDRDLVECVRPFAPVDHRREADVSGAAVGAGFADVDEPRRIGERQRPEKHRVDHAEDRRVRADAERERHDGDGREAGTAVQQPEPVADVAPQVDDEVGRGRRRRQSGAARPIRARDLVDHAPPVLERRQSARQRITLVHAGCDEIGVLLRAVLRQLVDDVGGARRVDVERFEPGADERPEIDVVDVVGLTHD